jgi:DNA primase
MLEELSSRTGISAENLRDYVATHKPPAQRGSAPPPPVQAPAQLGNQSRHQAPPNDFYSGPPPDDVYGDGDYEQPYPETVAVRRSKIRLSPIKVLSALLVNHPQLAEYVEDIEMLSVSADPDMTLFLKILALINSDPACSKTSHIFARWQATYSDQSELQLLKTLAGSELHQPPKGTGRDDDQEFSDTLSHVARDVFEALPPERKADILLAMETLNERQTKQLFKIHMQLGDNNQFVELKNKIKQRLVV